VFQPKKRKYAKEFRGNMRGISSRGTTLSNGEYGIKAIDRGWINSNQIESARKAINNFTKRKSKLWIKIFPHKSVTKKADEQVRGGGKGPVDHYVAVVRPGLILFELSGVTEDVAIQALKRASSKIPVKTKIVSK
jgi:large subunit ribosomal protein L16